jgi:hypothetical protein
MIQNRVTILVAAVLLCACSSGGSPVVADAVNGDTRPAADFVVPVDFAAPDSDIVPDLLFDGWDSAETEPDLPFVNCQPGDGCFMDKCSDNGDCQSGWCVEHMGEGVCSQACSEECPQGWSCKQVGASDPDLVFVCVSNHSNLCKPCAGADSCKALGGADDVCVDYGPEGSFCGGACQQNEDCPWGFSCLSAVTIDGIELMQCVADAGTCACSGKSIALALWTPCSLESEFGLCAGKRVCTEEGLSNCDAAVPVPETCDGTDEDCDGLVDEPEEERGLLIPLCDDSNDCTEDLCNGEGGCSHNALDQVECKDGDICTVADHCEAGECVGNPVVCDDFDPCTNDSCDGTGGCLFVISSGGSCDDFDPCTVADQCVDGLCSGTNVPCDCQEDADCSALEDGDLCNGTLFCNLEEWPYQCQTVLDSVVTCPQPEPGPDAICLAADCDPATGGCALIPDHEGFACEDGDQCTIGDLCMQGVCTAGADRICNDGNPCTDDSCDPEVGCFYEMNSSACSDGDVCTTEDYCQQGECVSGPALICDDANLCNGTESCNPATGCESGQPLVCDDQDICTGNESCDPVDGCQAGKPLLCDDANVCTDDSCDPNDGCHHVPNQVDCDDGNLCTLLDHCSEGVCKPGLALQCNDDNVCTDNSCAPLTGCVTTLNQAPCDDGDLCTTGDHCNLGECISGGFFPCDDGNACTDDSCNPTAGCIHLANQAPCDDGNLCTDEDLCTASGCLGKVAVVCDDDNLCTDDYCDPLLGCVAVLNNAPCNDQNNCTVNDACVGGICVGGAPLVCNDQNPCSDDTCLPETGCHYESNEAQCDDQNACTEDDQCQGGICLGGVALDCADETVCTADACDPAIGCTHSPVENPCDDGDACSVSDLCVDGACVGGGELDCDDADACTADLCESQGGCYHEPAGFLPCEDNNPCTTDQCTKDSGCLFTNVADYTSCGQGLVCLTGVCKPAPEVSVVFITSGTTTGNIGGLNGADQKCQSEADAAGLSGLFVAFLSTSSVDARDRIPDAKYLRVDKTVVADSRSDLLDGSLDAPINVTATGAVLTSTVRPWTGTNQSGTSTGNTCQNWTTGAQGECSTPLYTARSGEGTATNKSWTDLTNYCCWAPFTRLYCFQVLP